MLNCAVKLRSGAMGFRDEGAQLANKYRKKNSKLLRSRSKMCMYTNNL